jgi:3-carboxy-cis,cis-muconate cycloisomerase
MAVSPVDSAIYGALLSDDEAAALFGDEAEIRAMLTAEIGLARAQAACGLIPPEAASAITDALGAAEIAPASLAAGTAAAGVPVGPLVAAARKAVGEAAASWLHFGATSQDIMDTGLVLRLRDAVALIDGRLEGLCAALAERADTHRATVMAARTRWQQATPTTLGLKIAGWAAALADHRARLAELRPRLLCVQLGGASGTLAAMGGDGAAVMEAMAGELDLNAPPLPWHTARERLAEFAGFLSLLTGTLGKIGRDMTLLAQNEVAEARGGGAGDSSTMPHKANPVAAEMLVALARQNAGLVSAMHHALMAEHERSGEAWTAEWQALPQMAVGAAAALRHARAIADTLAADPAAMRRNIDASDGMMLAEAAAFALAAHMPREQAQALVTEACREAAADGLHLKDVLCRRSDAAVDWDAVFEPANWLGAADALIDRALAAVRATLP